MLTVAIIEHILVHILIQIKAKSLVFNLSFFSGGDNHSPYIAFFMLAYSWVMIYFTKDILCGIISFMTKMRWQFDITTNTIIILQQHHALQNFFIGTFLCSMSLGTLDWLVSLLAWQTPLQVIKRFWRLIMNN